MACLSLRRQTLMLEPNDIVINSCVVTEDPAGSGWPTINIQLVDCEGRFLVRSGHFAARAAGQPRGCIRQPPSC
jgi:hypothetical protein